MLIFTEKDIEIYFNIIKRYARKSLLKNDLEQCLKHIETAATIAYNFNWIYTDSDLEMMLCEISSRLIPTDTKYSPIKDRFVFYDYFALDNKGLTQQYIRALISWDVEFLFLVERNDLSQSTHIIQELRMYPKAEIFTLPSGDTRIEKIKKAYSKIADYRPEKLFMHLSPGDVVAISTLAAFPKVTKYQINLTDHAFWLGVSVTDYILEFRNYGCTVSIEQRGIRPDRLLVQPYYPITQSKSFKGLPPEVTHDKTIIFSGGSLYKVYGEDFAYFKILKRLLDENPTVVILFAGSGDTRHFIKFIKENHYEKRLFLIGNRDDINHIFSLCDIYLSTFPFSGGLMNQMAALNGKPILAYNKTNLSLNFIEDLLPYGENGGNKITFFCIDEMMDYAFKLINNKEFRFQEGEANKSRVINSKSFNTDLLELITKNINRKKIDKIIIDYNKLSSNYINADGGFVNILPFYLVARFKLSALFLFPKVVIKFVCNLFYYKHLLYKNFK